MKISSNYRGDLKELQDKKLITTRYIGGDVMLHGYEWNGNEKHYRASFTVEEQKRVIDVFRGNLDDISGHDTVTIPRSEYKRLMEFAAK